MSSKHNDQRLGQSESGMVAVMVTFIMIAVIGLIVVGFAQVTQRALRNTLDSQLSSQAFYAAETGVNDALAALQVISGPVTPKPDCNDLPPNYNFNTTKQSEIGGPTSGVSYSCLTIDPTPTTLSYSLTSKSDEVIAINSANGNILALTFSWTPAATVPTLNLCPVNEGTYTKAQSAWTCPFAVLRTELVPTDAGSLNRASLLANDRVNFLNPVRAGAGVMNATDNAKNVRAQCTTATCSVTMNFAGAGSSYYLRLRSLYVANANVSISGVTTTGQPIKFAGVQAQISVTGKAQDVLRRILVAVKLNGVPGVAPTEAIVSGDSICKRFSVTNGSFDGPETDIPGAVNNPVCDAGSFGNPTNP
jgi:hypothetical protein